MLLSDLPVTSPRGRRRKKLRGLLDAVKRIRARAPHSSFEFGPEDWSYFAHVHLDWRGYGDYSRKAREWLLGSYADLFRIMAEALSAGEKPFQLWLLIHPRDSGADCLYYHTPNPYGGFPVSLSHMEWDEGRREHLFTALLPEYAVREGSGGNCFAYYAEGVGIPPR